ncbi:hypothetical protein ACGFT2_15825 [Streptomyces sp. NPDC048514]|uniref:hypothetical protein n=1 Tax=Streptomyces sp. NPDC048514 TaxID=3365564 RepID=UPI0037243B85
MNEGTAALVAGLAGTAGALGGALIGAVAAVRGARIGAERAAQATRRQVQDQASAEHVHWLRQQRLEAYATLLAAYDAHVSSAFRTRRRLSPSPTRTAIPDEELDELLTTARAIRRERQRVKLVGPEPVHSKAVELEDAVWSHWSSLTDLADAVRDCCAEDDLFHEESDGQRTMAAAHNAFVRAVGSLLEAPVVTGDEPAGPSPDRRRRLGDDRR